MLINLASQKDQNFPEAHSLLFADSRWFGFFSFPPLRVRHRACFRGLLQGHNGGDCLSWVVCSPDLFGGAAVAGDRYSKDTWGFGDGDRAAVGQGGKGESSGEFKDGLTIFGEKFAQA